ncbi:MAG: SDR family oxidoreductase [Maricaulaceae bacterium]|nr:SDR family oxidoreductase [Maricaulaceae bacterium]
MTGLLDGKAALVTGGGRGIGAAIALRLARDGADVAISYGGSKAGAEAVAEQIRALGRRAELFQCDAAQKNATDALVRAAAQRLGRLDILVNNAGVYPQTTIRKCSDDEFDRTMAVNLRAPFEAMRAAYDVMNDEGAIITIGSVAAEGATVPGIGVYCASKAGVQLLARGAAREFGRRRIRSNIVQPGPIDTDMNPADGETADMQRLSVPSRRYGTAEEVAALVAWLASDESSYVNGAMINVDGGLKS